MRFHRIDDVPSGPEDVVFRASAVRAVVGSLSLLALMALVGGMAWHVSWWFALGGLFLLLFVPFIGRSVRGWWSGDDWVVRMRPGSLIVRLRSHMNSHFPREDVVAVELDRRELAGLATERQRLLTRSTTGDDTDVRKRFLHIHLCAAAEDVARLRELIAAERTREAPPRGCLGSRTKYLDYPASLIEDGGVPVLRVEWLGPATMLSPRLKRALSILSRLAPVLAETQQTLDTRNLKPTDPDAESSLIALVESGEVFAATRLARDLYGLSLADAKKFVNELAADASATHVRP